MSLLNAVAAQTINGTKTFGSYALPSLDFINKSFECLELIGWLAVPYPRIETRRHDINERAVDRNVEADLGMLREKPRDDGGENEVGGRRRNG